MHMVDLGFILDATYCPPQALPKGILNTELEIRLEHSQLWHQNYKEKNPDAFMNLNSYFKGGTFRELERAPKNSNYVEVEKKKGEEQLLRKRRTRQKMCKRKLEG